MKQFKQLEIHRDNGSLMALLDRMKGYENNDFFYNEEKTVLTKERTANDSIVGGTVYAIFSTKSEALYCANVFISVLGEEMKVFNITSDDPRYSNLGVSRYNFILDAFFHGVIARCIDETFTGCVGITGEEISLVPQIGERALEALSRWADTCNKEAPVASYEDEQAWMEFVSILHEEGRTLHPSDFMQWLSEDAKWPTYYNNVIADLGSKLEYSLSLLKYYGEHHNR